MFTITGIDSFYFLTYIIPLCQIGIFLSRGDLYYVLIKHFKLIAFDFSIVMAGLNAFNRLAELKG